MTPTQLVLTLESATAASTDTASAAPPPEVPHHRYQKNGDGKVICRRCTVERREAPTGRRQGFQREWRVLVEGQWTWTTACPPCLPAETTTRRRSR